MAIRKATWLSNFLLRLNFKIFAWELNIGDWIETAIDWVLSWLSWLADRAEEAFNWATAVWDKAVEFGWTIWDTLYKEINSIWNSIETWWSSLGEWWEAKKTDILDWISASWSRLGDWWEVKKTDILDWFSARLTDIKSWMGIYESKASLTDYAIKALESDTTRGQELLRQHKERLDKIEQEHYSLWDLIKDFFTDPAAFIYHLVDEIIERFW